MVSFYLFIAATKIEFYVGDVPDGYTVSLENARYTRLGFVPYTFNWMFVAAVVLFSLSLSCDLYIAWYCFTLRLLYYLL